MKLTITQQRALKALTDHGGEGILTKTGTMLVRGVELGHGDDGEGSREEGWEVDFFQRSTWKALASLGHIEEISPRRWRVKQDAEAPVSSGPEGDDTPPARDAKDDARHVRDYIGKASL